MSTTQPNSLNEKQEVSLLDFFVLFWKGKLIIVAITLLAAVISMIVALQSDIVFKSSAVLEYNEREPAVSQGISSLINTSSLNNSGHYSVSQAIAFLRSRDIIYKFFEKQCKERKTCCG